MLRSSTSPPMDTPDPKAAHVFQCLTVIDYLVFDGYYEYKLIPSCPHVDVIELSSSSLHVVASVWSRSVCRVVLVSLGPEQVLRYGPVKFVLSTYTSVTGQRRVGCQVSGCESVAGRGRRLRV